jgi:hypothetical protein
MDLKELFDLHEKLEARINAYWTYWSVAVIALGGWLFSGKQSFTLDQAIALAIAVSVFFLCNLGVLWPTTKLVIGVRDEIRLAARDKAFASDVLRQVLAVDGFRYRLQITLVLHLAIDAVAIWALLSRA